MVNNVYTTKQVGKFCGVDLTTVINWVKQGKIKAYKTAGGHRRIKKKDLLEFMKEFSIPLPDELEAEQIITVLIASDSRDMILKVQEALGSAGAGFRIEIAADGFEAGIVEAMLRPFLCIIQDDIPMMEISRIYRKIKDNDPNRKIFLVRSGEPAEDEKNLKLDGVLEKDFTPVQLAGKLKDIGILV